ncbi:MULTISPECIES: MOSC domain-containing protein [unclassified Marinovum]
MTGVPVTTQELDAALEHIRAAPKDGAVIDQLVFRPAVGARAYPDHLDMTVAGGIAGERWLTAPWLKLPDGTPDPRIQVSILSKRVMDLCWRDRDGTPHPGDPIVVDMDLGHDNLPVGTRLQAGTAILEVSDKRNSGCAKWQEWYGRDSLHWINTGPNRDLRLRGILCRIVQDGRVSVGDRLTKQPG